MSKFICNTEKYQLGGPQENTIGLPVFPKNLQEKIEINGYTLLRRDSFHVSLVAIGKITEKHQVEIPNFLNNVVNDFCEFVKNNPVELLRFRDEFKFVSQNEKRSVVVMCDISNLDKFFDLINKKYSLTLEYPPTHATLFTLQPNAGIYLVDSEDINNLTTEIPNLISFLLS